MPGLAKSMLIVLTAAAAGAASLTGPGGCAQVSRQRPAAAVNSIAMLHPGLGEHGRKVSTTSPAAQRYFDQGLVWTFAFNHDEAIRSFEHAARLDPQCAMAWWGVALCNGPHINNAAMDEAKSRAAWDALQKAMALRQHASPAEVALIDALSKRYAAEPPKDRRPLDEAYADAMRSVRDAYRDDADIATLYAESMMDLRPWDLWTKEGEPQPGTEEIVATLEHALRLNPRHPGANHLYIHAVEASRTPERAVIAADTLRDLVPGAGHLVHMPSHIDVRTGRWAAAAIANERAIAADSEYRKRSPRQGFYHAYMVHNRHFLAYTGMMEARPTAAIKAAREMIASVPAEFVQHQGALVDPYMGILYDVQKRFGMWDAILAERRPAPTLPVTTAMWKLNRGIAFAAKGQVTDARREQQEFRELVGAMPKETMMAINPAHDVMQIGDLLLNAEIDYREGRIDPAIEQLRRAVTIEDSLRYMEPPDWLQPIRHTLGAFLLEAGRPEEAERVYRDDLKRWPENGWSLQGLKASLMARGASIEAEAVGARLSAAWSRSEIKPRTTCLCVEPRN